MLEVFRTFTRDLKFAARSLARTKGLTATVVVTLALGIGANSAMFSVVRGVLLRPLANRDEDRLIYIQQSAKGLGMEDIAFSVPEIRDLRESMKSLTAIGDFSTMGFTLVGLGEPREIRAGVVGGNYFDVMGLHPVMGRLLGPADDGPAAAGAAVLTYRFWKTVLKGDPHVIGKVIRLSTRSATVVGVVEPSVPYPAETELFSNIVTSPHHLSATMVTGRVHRMTELFGRLAPGATLETARAELRTVHAVMMKQHRESYPVKANFRIDALLLRDQITSRAKTVLWVLLAAAGLVFVIACSNVANLILARTVRREGELAVRAALGAGTGALRQTLLAESLLLGLGGAALGVLTARPMAGILARYASRFSVRALDMTVDSSMLWVGAVLAVIAALLLAFVPRLPSAEGARGLGLSGGGVRITGGTRRRLRIFAVTQIAACFVLLAGAGMLLKTLLTLQSAETGFDTQHVLALNVPASSYGKSPDQVVEFYKQAIAKMEVLPGVDRVAMGLVAPWRDAGNFGPGFEFTAEGRVVAPGEEDPHGRLRTVSPGFFAALGVPLLAGRDFNDQDRRDAEPVVIVSRSVAQRMFPSGDALNHHVMWTDPVMKFVDISTGPRRIVGIVADVDDENVIPGPAMTIYHPFSQIQIWGGRMFIHGHGDLYSLVTPVTRIVREMSPETPVEKAATLADIRAEVLTPDRLNTLVFGGFAAVALAIAIVGVAGVLAFSVSQRTREFGIRLAVGAEPRHLVTGVISEGAVIAAIGVAAGGLGGYALAKLAGAYFEAVRTPGALVIIIAAAVLLTSAVVASVLPALRAARIDVVQALRAD